MNKDDTIESSSSDEEDDQIRDRAEPDEMDSMSRGSNSRQNNANSIDNTNWINESNRRVLIVDDEPYNILAM